jgi:hypothetical protein
MYSTTSGVSILGEFNGGLTIDNFHSSFRLMPEHILPGHNEFILTENSTKPLVIVDNMVSTSSEDDIAFTGIPGAGKQFFCSSTRNTVEFSWQIYYHAFRYIGVFSGSFDKKSIVFMAFLDGAPIYSTRHKVAITSIINATTTPNAYGSNEAQGAQTLSQNYFANSLSAGFHSFEVRCWLERTNTDETQYKLFRGTNVGTLYTVTAGRDDAVGGYMSDFQTIYATTTDGYHHDIYNRLTMGVRNIIVTQY